MHMKNPILRQNKYELNKIEKSFDFEYNMVDNGGQNLIIFVKFNISEILLSERFRERDRRHEQNY